MTKCGTFSPRSVQNMPKKTKLLNDSTIEKSDNSKTDLYGEIEFRELIEDLPVIFYVVEPFLPFKPIYVSSALKNLGYSLDEWFANPNIWVSAIHEDDRERILKESAEAVAAAGRTDYEYRIVGKKGEIYWVRDRRSCVCDEAGKVVRLQGLIMDITDRKFAKQEIERREELYRTFTRNLPNTAVLLFDSDLRYILAEGDQLSEHGLAAEKFEGKTIFDIFPKEICDKWSSYYRRALAGEKLHFEWSKNDNFYDIYILPVKNERGEIFAGMVMWHDITARKVAENALKESEIRYRNLFENASDLIYIHDLKGNYLSINGAVERVFGYTREEALKLNMRQIIVPEQFRTVKRRLKEKIAGKKQTVYEADCLTKDGKQITLEINSTAIYKDGLPIAIQGTARDITERKHAEQALKDSEESYRELVENANDLIYTHDLEGNFTSLNRAGEIITGFLREEALPMNISQVVAPEFLELARQMIQCKVDGEDQTAYQIEIINKDGKRVSLEISTRLIVQNGKPVGVQGIGRDITERLKAEADLKSSEESYRLLGEGIMHQVWTARPDGKLDYVNGKTKEYFGREPIDLIEENWQTVVHPNDLPECIENWTYALKTGNDYETEFRLLRCDGEYRWHLARASAGRDAKGNIVKWFGTNTDIHNQKLAESKLNHYARHDALTNLPNRVEFMSRLKDTIDRSFGNGWSRFAVLFLDLDRFKVINDSLGHDIGDKLLISIAERLKSCVRPGDIVARLGGDEFTILLHRTGEIGDVEKIADRLQKRLSEPFQLGSYEVFTSVSIGIILSDGEHRKPEDYLRDADSAMYRAKDAGKARYEIFDREMHVRNMNLLRIETDLRHALERHEFEVNYQPIVSLRTGKVVEFEALLRWRHPEYGLVAPNEFISVAEETGLIIPIGRWILEEACRQTVEWQKRFPAFKSLPISVNLSAKQLMHPNLTTQVREILFKTSLKAKCLQLEVTESTVMEHHETAQQVLNELHDIGAHLSTDDFGTGYSSLSYLHRFPFDRLKIDRSFINRMDSNEKCEAIVRTLLLLGQNLNLEIVAEGIETEKQLRQLQNLGCDYGQGYLFSKPVSAMKAEKLLQNGIENFPAEDSFVFGGNRELIEIRDIQ